MKKILLSLFALLATVGAWAQTEYTLNLGTTQFANGASTYSYHGSTTSGSWYGKLVTSTTPAVTIESTDAAANNIGYSSNRPWLKAGYTYNITIAEGYEIVGYTLTTQSTSSGYSGTFTYTTSTGTGTSEAQVVNQNKQITVDGLNVAQIEITIDGEATNSNYGILLPSLSITYIYKDAPTEITYTLIDVLGNEYRGTYEGVLGLQRPEISGVNGYTLTDEKWGEGTYEAVINFPFSISSVSEAFPTMIGSFGSENYRWYADGTGIKTKKETAATSANVLAHMWAIYPLFSDGAFAFTIKNMLTGTYIYSTSASNSHDAGAVVLSETASSLTFEADNRFKLSTDKYLSCNSTSGDVGTVQNIGTWGEHNGCNLYFGGVSFEYTIGSAGYATLCSPVDGVTSNVTTYIITTDGVHDGYVTLTENEGIIANEGFIVKGDPGTYTLSAAVVNKTWGDSNLLKGSSVNKYIEGSAYVLSMQGEEVGLYKAELNKDASGAEGDTHFLNNAGKAYLPASAVLFGARSLRFDFGSMTGIEEVKNENDNVKAVVYDLAGRRVQSMQKGIFIVNGKKVAIK